MNDEKMLKIKAEVAKLQSMYAEDQSNHSFNCLLLGESGSGKTFLMRTARKPVHIDSFDPGGAKGLDEYIRKGEVIVDSRYGNEDPKKPFAFELWKKEMAKREQLGYFEMLGTYCLDSSTTWAESIMNEILKRAGLAGAAPRFTHDYNPQKIEIRNWLRELLALPCDFILTGHLESYKDEVTGGVSYRYATTGKGVQTIPLLFDEIWVMSPKSGSKGVDYRILTQSTGTYVARSRLAKDGLLSQYEEANIKTLLKKAKMNYDDKQLLI